MTENYRDMYPAVTLAQDIIDMHARIDYLEKELEFYKPYYEKYNELIQQSIKDGQETAANWLKFLLSNDITPKKESVDNEST